ncbi:MAG: hypothetical protein HC849_26020 [Oscillatoriales cyanobacterium RU_3_3]|nr:hypothetical protein [Microcoleus sp. SU_5_6]NJL69364.1 hypothetical protein [Microcoleus sp. SM1_3_4]NJM62863.1 hypothetical protein [Oscillatoriales cyanobacterium RU_3_3]
MSIRNFTQIDRSRTGILQEYHLFKSIIALGLAAARPAKYFRNGINSIDTHLDRIL